MVLVPLVVKLGRTLLSSLRQLIPELKKRSRISDERRGRVESLLQTQTWLIIAGNIASVTVWNSVRAFPGLVTGEFHHTTMINILFLKLLTGLSSPVSVPFRLHTNKYSRVLPESQPCSLFPRHVPLRFRSRFYPQPDHCCGLFLSDLKQSVMVK